MSFPLSLLPILGTWVIAGLLAFLIVGPLIERGSRWSWLLTLGVLLIGVSGAIVAVSV